MDPVRTCALCPKLCRFACPVASATGDENATPTGIGTVVLLHQKRTLHVGPEGLHPLYRCTGCLGCQVPCDFDIDVPAWLQPEKQRAWEVGEVPALVRETADRVADGATPDDASGHHRDLDGPRFAGEGIVYWPGCALVGRRPAAVEANRALLEHALGEPVVLPPASAPACCGDPLEAAGDRSRYLGHRATLSSALRGATKVVTSCACCLDSLPGEALHITSVLGFSWPYRGPQRSVAFHDPCRFARPDDLGGAPRALIAAATGEPALEFVDRAGETGCCGAGDSFALFFPGDGRDTAGYRLRDPAASRAGTVVTACSRCTAHLDEASPEGVEVVDLAEVLVDTIPVADPPDSASPVSGD